MKYLGLLTCLLFISTSEAGYSYQKSGSATDNREKVSDTNGAEKREDWEEDSIGTSRAATLRRDTTRSVTRERCVDSNGMVMYKNDDGYRNCVKMNRSR